MKYFWLFLVFFAGLILGLLGAFVHTSKTYKEQEVFNQTVIMSKYNDLAASYFLMDADHYKEFLLCSLIKEDEIMKIISESVDLKDKDVSIYGGQEVLNISSQYLFEDLGLSYEEYQARCK